LSSDPNKHPNGTPLTDDQAVEILETGTIIEQHGMMRWSSNYAFLVDVAHEDTTVMAVYKPQRGERPLWDFPDGTLCYRERAAYVASCELGWRIVPPTVLRHGQHGLGSVQLYIEHDPAVNYFNLDEHYIPRLMQFTAFDYVVNNADRKGGHCLKDEQGQLWGIDHGIAFHEARKLRTVIWDFAGRTIPDDILADLDRLCDALNTEHSALVEDLDELLSKRELNAFAARVRKILQTRRFPRPGPGPNYPWPPV